MSGEDPIGGEEQEQTRTWTEKIEVAGGRLADRVKELVAEGNVRRLIVRRPSGGVIMEVPLTAVAVVGGVVTIANPVLTIALAAVALMTKVRVDVVRTDEGPEQ